VIKISDKNGRIKSGPTYKRSRLPVSFTKSNADKEKIKPVKREPVSPANILELLPKLKGNNPSKLKHSISPIIIVVTAPNINAIIVNEEVARNIKLAIRPLAPSIKLIPFIQTNIHRTEPINPAK
jgi:hypothetical protein